MTLNNSIQDMEMSDQVFFAVETSAYDESSE